MPQIAVKRDFEIIRSPQEKLKTGAIFWFTGSPYDWSPEPMPVLVHRPYVHLEALKEDCHEVAAVEYLYKEQGYSDYCLVWTSVQYLRSATEDEIEEVLKVWG